MQAQIGAAGAARVAGNGGLVTDHLLHHHLTAGQAHLAGNHRAAKAAAESQRHAQNARQDPFAPAAMVPPGRLGRLLGCAGIAVPVVAVLAALIAGGVAAITGLAVIGARRVGGVGPAAAHVGVAVLRGFVSVIMLIKAGVIIFVVHLTDSFLLCLATVYPQIVKSLSDSSEINVKIVGFPRLTGSLSSRTMGLGA